MPAGKLLWKPDSSFARKSKIAGYLRWLDGRGLRFEGYEDLWKWSVEDLEGFWASIWRYYDVADADYPVLGERKMPGARWFEGADVNFSERVFARRRDGTAVVGRSEGGKERRVSWAELERKSACLASRLREMGVGTGDRVAAFLPNSPEAIIAFLACASLGAVWSCCSPEFGAAAVVDRFGQIGPKVLLAANGYEYGGKWFDRTEVVEAAVGALPSLKAVVEVDGGGRRIPGAVSWGDVTAGKAAPSYEPVPFDHPLWVLYSSGTTGAPKPIVHGQGGILLEFLKVLSMHNDIGPDDRFFWYTTTGWMMWNYLVGGLLHGATVVLYDGNPGFPRIDSLWDMVEGTQTTYMGASAAFFSSCQRAGLAPGETHKLPRLRGIGSTGSPLSPESFEWVYSKVLEDLWLASVSGGTDVCTTFVGGCPTLPVHSGEIQCRCLGAKVEAFDEEGKPVVGQVGELVVTEPMPSMPLYLWGDSDGARYRESYFDVFPGAWRHGDWVKITKRGSCVIYGRSDATLKRQGVRIGTSEIYRVVESIPEVSDSMAVNVEGGGRSDELLLFVALSPGLSLDEGLAGRIRAKIRDDLSPRYVPDELVQVPSVPRTLNGKKLEVPIRKILMGADPDAVFNRGSLSDPGSVDYYVSYAKRVSGGKP
jgi:acetoacetyl-CoA synthetase